MRIYVLFFLPFFLTSCFQNDIDTPLEIVSWGEEIKKEIREEIVVPKIKTTIQEEALVDESEQIIQKPKWVKLQGTEIFVSSQGDDDNNDGTTQQQAYRTIQKALDRVEPGQIVYIQAGKYSPQSLSFPQSGLPGKPIILEWYSKIPGDTPIIQGFDYKSSLDPEFSPLLDGGNRAIGKWFILKWREYISLKNLQISNYSIWIDISKTNHVYLENIILTELWNIQAKYNGKGISMRWENSKNTLKRITVVNAAAEWIFISWNNHILDNIHVYADDSSTATKSATDYYIVLTGVHNSVVKNSYIERVGELAHRGHGFSLKWNNTGNTIKDNIAVNMDNGGFVVRHRGTQGNTFIGNEIRGWAIGLLVRDGASNNVFQDISILKTMDAIVFLDSTEDEWKQWWGSDNTFENITIKGTERYIFSFNGNTYRDTVSARNHFSYFQIEWGKYLIEWGHVAQDNILENSSISWVSKYIQLKNRIKEGNIDFILKDVDILDSGF